MRRHLLVLEETGNCGAFLLRSRDSSRLRGDKGSGLPALALRRTRPSSARTNVALDGQQVRDRPRVQPGASSAHKAH
eukprot:3715452-Pleurochrysis_carterae.AAC.1